MIDLAKLRKRSSVVTLDRVNSASFNPPIRTANKTGDIDALGQDIKDNGQLEAIHVVEFPDGTFHLADGHRRVAGMKKVGIKTATAVIYSPGTSSAHEVLAELFKGLSSKKRRLANRDMVEAGLRGGPIFNSGVQSTVSQLETLFPAGIPTIVKDNAGSYVLSIAKRVVAYCYKAKPGTATFTEKTANALLWLIRNKQQQKAVAYIRVGFSADALRRAIENNKLAPRVNG